MEIKLYGHSAVYKTYTNGMEGRRRISPTPVMIVLDPLARVAVEEVKGGIREEKRFLLPKMWSEALESSIQKVSDDCVRQAKELPDLTETMVEENDCCFDALYFKYSS